MLQAKAKHENEISQLFTMRTAIAKSRYKNPVGVFVALRPSEPERAFFPPDKIPDSLFPPTNRNPSNRMETDQCPFIRLDVPNYC
jgi:hypothetical protein